MNRTAKIEAVRMNVTQLDGQPTIVSGVVLVTEQGFRIGWSGYISKETEPCARFASVSDAAAFAKEHKIRVSVG